MIFETHAHVHDAKFDADRPAMLVRAREAGVGRIVTVGCDLPDSAKALAAASEFDLDWTLGIHPHEAKDAPADVAAAFDEAIAAASKTPVAIGETGLDYYYDHSPRGVQGTVMRAQVRYARERGFPVVFHQRDAFDDFIALLADEWRPHMRGIIHCFTGNPEQAERLCGEFGMLLGIGGVLTFKTAQPIRDAAARVGLAKLVLETDCPYLAPIPMRGKRNEPAFIVHTAAVVAQVCGATYEETLRTTTHNAEAFFTR